MRATALLVLGKAQIASNVRFTVAILGVSDSVINNDFFKIKRADAFDASDIDAIFIRARAAFVMGIDTALGAEIMLGGHRAELIFGQHLLAFEKLDAIQWC